MKCSLPSVVALAALTAVATSVVVSCPASAQHRVAVESTPRVNGEPLLSRHVAVNLDRVSIRQAIDAISASGDVKIQYQTDEVDAYTQSVSLHVADVPLGVALEHVLNGTRLRVVVLPGPHVAVIESGSAATAGGIVTGRVVNGKTKAPVTNAAVWLDDSTHSTHTDEAGHFRFLGVAAGSHHVSVRAIGFGRQVRLVTVTDDQTSTVDFSLDASVNTLDQVVVTATGAQRIRELGHVVSQINADSLVKEAPITSVADLLQSRVPGLEVLTGSGGIAGGPVSLRLRGQSSLFLSSEPIVIVDGVRIKTNNLTPSESPDTRGISNAAEPSSPINDLNVNDIENVEVVKGPSASTLYGPDGANGVIVITTKRGRAGKTEWNWYAHPLSNAIPRIKVLTPTTYRVWSHDPNDPARTPLPYTCTLMGQYYYKACVIDSIAATPSVVQQPALTTIGPSKPTWQYGVNVGGGVPVLRYYFSGDYLNQIGNVQVPTILQDLLKQQLGVSSLSDAIRNPSTSQILGGHGTVTAAPSDRIDVTATVDYHQTSQRVFAPSVALNPQMTAALPIGATGVFGDSLTDQFVLGNLYSVQVALQSQQAQAQHVGGSIQGAVRPLSWLTATALIGLDLDDQTEHDLQPSSGTYSDGVGRDTHRNSLGRTVTLNLGARNRRGMVSFQSALGVNYVYSRLDGIDINAYNLPPGSSSIGTASQTYTTPLWSESVSLGTYAQEVLGFADQLYLDAGLRIDGSTRFGDKYHPAALPKVGLSWIASDAPMLRDRLPGVSDLRFRTSYGASTRYPTAQMKIGSISSSQIQYFGQTYVSFSQDQLSNPDLRPETSREFEYGADATILSRLQVGLTRWSRRTHDELIYAQLPGGLQPQMRNLASVSQDGFEATASLPVLAARAIQADLQFTYSHQSSKVLSLGQNPLSTATTGLSVGYPVESAFGIPIVDVKDTVGGSADGVWEYGEQVYGSRTYYGVFEPPTTFTVTPQVNVLGGHVRLSSVFDRETGFVVVNTFLTSCAILVTCKAAYEISTSPLEQARLFSSGNIANFVEPGNFTRWRELNLTMDLPTRFLRLDALHLAFSRASLSLQGRNLALWSPNTGTDPESHSDPGLYGPSRGGIPQARSWGFRFDLTP